MESISSARRWSMLAISLAATLSATVFINGVAFLIPALDAQRHIGLEEATLLSSMPSMGMVITLIGWGYLLDIIGERIVLTVGLALTAAAGFGAASAHSMLAVGVFLFLGGMAAASSITASGRLVTGWFRADQQGVVMGIRQTAQPLGIGLAALVLPELGKHDFSLALFFAAAACAGSAVASALGVLDPPRPTRAAADDSELVNPYRGPAVLSRIHLASALLVVPQNVILTFMLVWLVGKHGWSIGLASVLLAASQVVAALARIAAGRWSDRVGSRMRPIRIIAVAATVVTLLLALTDQLNSPLAVAFMLVAAAITGDNGLPFIAIPEYAGRYWSGRALGTQHTAERVTFAVAPPVFGELITATGYPLAYAMSGLLALAALPFIPVGSRANAGTPSRATADDRPTVR